ncbi:MAG: DUF5060 domain-containing protein [Candidatus Latescibacteria bacterium]|nr:DUF5060 domain-containing protein [Candidatus Latescibacterota bacterium]
MKIQRWDTFELSHQAQQEHEYPFRFVDFSATFEHAESGRQLTTDGFYDGEATWRLRFMPTELGAWHYTTRSNDPGLDGHQGAFDCVAPNDAFLRGPVASRGYHFFHADGTPRLLLSTRLSCHFQEPEVWQAGIDYLAQHKINRVLFIMGGVHGTVHQLYGASKEGEAPDFFRYNLEKFRAIDRFIDALRRADILAAPYFYYFNDRTQRGMTPEQDRAYLRYGMARFGAYCNVLPVLSNEVDQKFTDRRGQYDLDSHVWANQMGGYLKGLSHYGAAVTVHNPMETEYATNPGFYTLLRDWPFPWTDYMLRQAQLAALSAPEIGDDVPEAKEAVYNVRGYARHNELLIDLRRFGIPVINEEPGYEMAGNGPFPEVTPIRMRPWNSQTADSLVPTFWSSTAAGGYVMWGNFATYWMKDPLPGLQRSPTPRHLRILHDFVTALPYYQMEPANELVDAAPIDFDGTGFRSNFCLAKKDEIYLVFTMAGAVKLELGEGTYATTQLDPRSGREIDLGTVDGGVQRFALEGEEQVLLCQRTE